MIRHTNSLASDSILKYFEKLRQSPHLYFQPITPEAFLSHAMSLMTGVRVSTDTIAYDDYVSARQHAVKIHGWQNNAFGPHIDMREKGYSDEEILPELIRIEIKMWQILDQWEKENMLKLAETKRED